MRKVFGIGICDSNCMENGKQSKCYRTWISMLQRCYTTTSKNKWSTYTNCSVDPEWHLFSNFKEFYKANYRDGYELDKDLLVPGNKVYSKDNCRFVPKCVNCLFLDNTRSKGGFPKGVYYYNTKNGQVYYAQISINSKQTHLGYYVTPEEASNAYRQAKKEYSILVANREYDAGNIPLEIRDAIINRANML